MLFCGISIGVIGTAFILSNVAEHCSHGRVQLAQSCEPSAPVKASEPTKRTSNRSSGRSRKPAFVKGSLLTHYSDTAETNDPNAAKTASVDKKPPEQNESSQAAKAEKGDEKKNYSWAKPEEVAKDASVAKPGVVTTVRHYVVTYHQVPGRTYVVNGPQQAVTTTASGYTIPCGDGTRAVDHPDSGIGPWTIGRNGMRQNPCVDPPSSWGRAYNANGAY